jgi:hypothetical protein
MLKRVASEPACMMRRSGSFAYRSHATAAATVGHRVVGVASTTPKRPCIQSRADVLLTTAETTENDRRSLL